MASTATETRLSHTLLSTIINELRSDPNARREFRDLLTEHDRGDCLLSPADAAARLGVHPKTLTRAAAAGRVPGAVRVGRHWRFAPDELALEAPTGIAPVPAGVTRLRPRAGRTAADAIRSAAASSV
jgi:excisionase family DNA binding protein